MTITKKKLSPMHALLRMLVRYSVLYAMVCAAVFAFQRSLLYFPSHRPPSGRLSAWMEGEQVIGYAREVSQPNTVWLMMHGNAGQASDRDYVLDRMSPSDSLYVLEYPGYGARPGKPCRTSIDDAALHAYHCLVARYPDIPIGVIGESIGSGPACYLSTAPRRPDKIVLIAPFDSLYRVASRKFFFLPVGLLLLDRWDNIDALRTYDGPVDIFGARDDNVIPIEHARNLADHCPTAWFHEVSCGHNDWSYNTAIKITR